VCVGKVASYRWRTFRTVVHTRSSSSVTTRRASMCSTVGGVHGAADSKENLDRTLDYLDGAIGVERDIRQPHSGNKTGDIERIYLRITGDTGSIDDAMHRIARLRRFLRPRGVYPISIVWTARLASAFAVGIKACMRDAVERMPDPTDDRNDLIEALIRPLGRPLWNQLKLEARAVAGVSASDPTRAGPRVNNSFECEPFEQAPKSLSLACSEDKHEFELAGIPLVHQIESGPEMKR